MKSIDIYKCFTKLDMYNVDYRGLFIYLDTNNHKLTNVLYTISDDDWLGENIFMINRARNRFYRFFNDVIYFNCVLHCMNNIAHKYKRLGYHGSIMTTIGHRLRWN